MGKILVTGANGFVGSVFCAHLAERGVPFTGAVRRAAPGRLAVGDIDEKTDWHNALSDVGTVVHLANRAHVMREVVADPLAEFRRINVDGTLNLARQAVAAGTRRFVYVSSIKVNGEATTGHPFTARDAPAPQDPYAISKWEAEQALTELSRQTGMEIVIVRPPLIYGPGVKANLLRLIQAVQRGVPMPFGAVCNARSMVSVDNLCSALLACATHPAAAGQTFLVSDGQDLSTAELIRVIAKGVGRRPRLIAVPPSWMLLAARALGKQDAARRVLGSLQVDSSALTRQLGWRAPYRIEDKLAEAARDVVVRGRGK
ncbi:UDP-glucose 4-epimerase [Cupriavidus taiwanensis]|uniref:UDP-glucose 4-epimerase family protein n=1 Tax=Cupriavidus taiwanensis TaxID=164546 RepID=UPI000E128EF1|nr:SDR family oxidoreductase [Cupriavidus taiwanensis]SOZ13903.1 UDP-glucose 4-epimerase [Cupriavidus taiwanensis]SOZ24614.1 UDP-glucose 4-epimerase [Cupriavidus taiwanensis]SOZ44516.1 UDP-glucose 4-epimerase [Cupriavidus taiwanensis]